MNAVGPLHALFEIDIEHGKAGGGKFDMSAIAPFTADRDGGGFDRRDVEGGREGGGKEERDGGVDH
jgi:hypothetical protein